MNFVKCLRTPFFTEHLWRLLLDDTKLVQKFETFWGAKYASKNYILYHRSCKVDRLNNSRSGAHKRDADVANDREEAKKQKERSCSTGQ